MFSPALPLQRISFYIFFIDRTFIQVTQSHVIQPHFLALNKLIFPDNSMNSRILVVMPRFVNGWYAGHRNQENSHHLVKPKGTVFLTFSQQ